jgi:hypothetical protein
VEEGKVKGMVREGLGADRGMGDLGAR